MTVEDVESSETGGKNRLEPKEITKLNFDEGCEFYSLKVPKGFDIKKLKVGSKFFSTKFHKNLGIRNIRRQNRI